MLQVLFFKTYVCELVRSQNRLTQFVDNFSVSLRKYTINVRYSKKKESCLQEDCINNSKFYIKKIVSVVFLCFNLRSYVNVASERLLQTPYILKNNTCNITFSYFLIYAVDQYVFRGTHKQKAEEDRILEKSGFLVFNARLASSEIGPRGPQFTPFDTNREREEGTRQVFQKGKTNIQAKCFIGWWSLNLRSSVGEVSNLENSRKNKLYK